jgi:hypothetical protein
MSSLETCIEKSINLISNRLYEVELLILSLAGKRLKDIYEIKDISTYYYSADTNNDLRKLQPLLNQAHKLNLKDMAGLFNDITAEVYSEGNEIAEYKNTRLSPLTSYRQSVNPLLRQAVRNYEVMAKSTTVTDTYKKTIRQYVNRLANGGEENAPSAMRKAIRELTSEGIATVEYKNGRKQRLDTAVRRDLMGEYGQIVRQVQQKLADEIGMDGVEITVEDACAWDHIDAQGRVFTLEEFEKLNNFETAEDIDGVKVQLGSKREIGTSQYNCRHMAIPFLIGIDERSYSQEELEAINKRNEEGIIYKGENISLYEASQEQRRLEAAMRHEKENINLLNEVKYTDPVRYNEYRNIKNRLAELNKEYKQLGAVLQPAAMRMKSERAGIPRGSTGSLILQPIKRNINNGVTSDFQAPAGIGAMAERFHVKTGMKTQYDNWHIQEGSYVSGVKVIAKGTKINDIDRLINTYKLQNGSLTNPKDWYKVRGTAIVTDNNTERMTELHWYQCKNIGKVEFKVKRYYN